MCGSDSQTLDLDSVNVSKRYCKDTGQMTYVKLKQSELLVDIHEGILSYSRGAYTVNCKRLHVFKDQIFGRFAAVCPLFTHKLK